MRYITINGVQADTFMEKQIMKPYQLFTFCATIGFKYGEKMPYLNRGKDTRGFYFKEPELTSLYSIIINDPDIGQNLEAFSDDEFIKKGFKTIEEYAEGGMQVILEKFGMNWGWNGETLSEEYDEFAIDLLHFVLNEQNKDSF